MLKWWNKFYDGYCHDWENKNYPKVIGKSLLFGAGSFPVILLITLLATKIYSFVTANWEFLFLVGGGSVVAIIFIKLPVYFK